MRKLNIDFMSNRRYFWLFSLTAMTIGAICNILMGTEIDMRFTGGTVMRYAYYENAESTQTHSRTIVVSDSDMNVSGSDTASGSDIEGEVEMIKTIIDAQLLAQAVSDALGVRATISINDVLSGSDGETKTLVVTFTEDESALGHNADYLVRRAIRKTYPNITLVLKESNSYNPILGREFFLKCIIAVLLAVVCMLSFLSVRFRGSGGLSLGGCGLLGVIHDVLIVYFAFVILRYPIDNNFIAALLAVIGSSLNSKIIVFDRIRENRNLFGGRFNVIQIANLSLNETVIRILSTNLCLLAVLAILALVSWIEGLDSTLYFSLPMMFGVISCSFSTLCFTPTLWCSWSQFRQRMRNLKEAASVK